MWITWRVLAMAVAAIASVLVTAPAAAADGPGDAHRVGVGGVVQLVADGDNMCALTEGGDVYCWDARGASGSEAYGIMALVALGALLIAGGLVLVLVTGRRQVSRRSATEPRPGTGRLLGSTVRCNPAGSSFPRSPVLSRPNRGRADANTT